MVLDAKLAGTISALLFFLVAWLLAYGIGKTRKSSGLKLSLFLVSSGLLLFVVPPPIAILGQFGVVEIAQPGHAGGNFIAPYLAGGLLAMIVFAVRIRRKGAAGVQGKANEQNVP
ncbi:MAG: hypothetical protein KDJ39_11920 [Gammaproteobacteria bacterium]|nr:hypothetical protein [Gammaproteobacteria bacterium]